MSEIIQHPRTPYIPEGIPENLKNMKRWIVYEIPPWEKGKEKPAKILRTPDGNGFPAKGFVEREEMGVFEEVNTACKKSPNYYPAFWVFPSDGILFLDYDEVNGTLPALPTFDSYTERSVYVGYHVLAYYEGKVKPTIPDVDVRTGWIVMTGNIVNKQSEMKNLNGSLAKYLPRVDDEIKIYNGFVAPAEAKSRHPVLKSMVSSMVAKNYSFKAILAAAQAENLSVNKPPKPAAQIEKEVISLYDWVTKKQIQKESVKKEPEVDHNTSVNKEPVVILDEESELLAKKVYESGEFINNCVEIFRKIWKNDSHILKGVLYQVASYKLVNPDEGIHIHISGTTQSGKSDSVKTALKFVPPYYYENRTFSPKWIFHAEAQGKLHKNMILFSDDTILDPEVSALYRNMLTSWHEGVTRGTVINNKAVDLTIPAHISLILTSVDNVVEETKEGQDESRFLTLEVRRTKEQEEEIREFIQEPKIDVSAELSTVHCIWSIIPIQEVVLHKKIDKACTIREFKRYLTLLKCNALLHNRTTTNDIDIDDVDKFLTYSKPMIDAQTPAHKRDEDAIVSTLNGQWKDINEIMKETKLPYARVVRAIHGVKGTFDNPGGGLLLSMKSLKMDYNPEVRKYSFSISFI